MMRRAYLVGVVFALCFGFTSRAQATVVTFDDLVGQDLVPDGYGGINWGGVWTYYGFPQDPYNPSSDPNRVYDFLPEGQFTFVTPGATFDGAWFSGFADASVQFALYTSVGDLLPVAYSAILAPTGTPTFLASGYSGLVSKVGVISPRPDFFVMDDVTYNSTAVPEPATLWLLGSGLAGVVARRRRKNADS